MTQMKEKNFDIRNLFKDFVKHEDVFDEVEQKIEREKMKRKLKQDVKNVNFSEKIENNKLVIKSSQVSPNCWNLDLLRSQINDFAFDDACVYDFGNNQIKKITRIEEYTLKSPLVVKKNNHCDILQNDPLNTLHTQSTSLDTSIKTLPISYTSVNTLPKHSTSVNTSFDTLLYNTFPDYDKLVFLETKIHLKDKEITKEILRTLIQLDGVEGMSDICTRCYEKLIENGLLIQELFDYKRDIRVLDKLNRTECLSEKYILEYLTYSNKSIEIKTQCKCLSCVICKLIPPSKYQEIVDKCSTSIFYKPVNMNKLTLDEILKLKFELICNEKKMDNNNDMDGGRVMDVTNQSLLNNEQINLNKNALTNSVSTFLYALFGFTVTKLKELIGQQEIMNVFTRAICLIMKNTKIEKVDDIEIVFEVYNKVQSLFDVEVVEYKPLIEQIDSYYKKFDELNSDFFKIEMSLKELVRVFKMKSNDVVLGSRHFEMDINVLTGNLRSYDNNELYNVNLQPHTNKAYNNQPSNNPPLNNTMVIEPQLFITNLFLPYNLIFILKSIFKHKSLSKYLIYEMYEKLSKFIVPFSFYDELFSNQNDFTLHFIRAKEVFKFYQLTQEKTYLARCLKYINKKINEIKFKDKIYKFKLLKAEILTNINLFSEAYNEIRKYYYNEIYNVDVCKILSYSNLNKAIEECEKVKGNYKSILLMMELKIASKEGSEIGTLFNRNSTVNFEIENEYLQYCKSSYEVQLSYIRYLKYRDLKRAHEYITSILKKRNKRDDGKYNRRIGRGDDIDNGRIYHRRIDNDYKIDHHRVIEKVDTNDNDSVYYELFIVKRKLSLVSYKVLYSNRQSDLLNQEIAYVENKDCDISNSFFYLFLYKKIKKECKGGSEHLNYFLKEVTKGNGDCLVILRILYNFSEENLLLLNLVYQVENGFYWTRTRKIVEFKKRLKHTIEIFEYDQNY